MTAEVVLHLGRFHLVVRGVYLAMETDLCRDPAFASLYWTKAMLDQAAQLINEERYLSAADRMKRGDAP
jgi:hypothetical protein